MDVVRQSDFEEFQYGKDVFQTTTNNVLEMNKEGMLLHCLAMVT